MKPRILDLYCGGGGAAMGYHLAGFEVVGGDALHFLEGLGVSSFDAIHASPPCQAFTVYGNNRAHVRDDHPDLIEPTREALETLGLPYVIENVPRAPLVNPIQLCGTSFGLLVRRHRLFESSVKLTAPPCDHGRFTERIFPGSTNRPNGRTVCNVGEYRVPLVAQAWAMEIDWLDLAGLSQAIPPAYTRHIGLQLRKEIGL